MSDPRPEESRRGQPEWLVVTRREFLERVRSKWFIIVTLLGPIGLAGLIVLPPYLASQSQDSEVRIHVVDRTPDKLGATIQKQVPDNFKLELIDPSTAREDLTTAIRDNDIDGFLIMPEDMLDGGEVVYEGANTSNLGLLAKLQLFIHGAAVTKRAERAGVPPDKIISIFLPINFTAKQNTGTDESSSASASFVLGYVVMILLYMSILLYAVNVMRSVVEEKTSRVVEIMISAVKPRALMLGKILGVGAVGLLQLAIWAGLALVMLKYQSQLLGVFGIDGTGDFEMPAISALDLGVVLAYFFTGFFFFAALYAAIGAMVNSDQEAQQAQTPVVILLIIPVLCAQLVATDPRGSAAELLTLIPFSSPILMPMRYLLGGATLGDVAMSLAILVAALAVVVWLAGRIYRVGILMYGKRPSLRELARWLRYQ